MIEAQGWAVLFAIGDVTANTELVDMAMSYSLQSSGFTTVQFIPIAEMEVSIIEAK